MKSRTVGENRARAAHDQLDVDELNVLDCLDEMDLIYVQFVQTV